MFGSLSRCIPCRTHAGGTPVTPLVYANFEGWHTPEAQRSKGPCVEVAILLRQYAKEHILSYIHAATPTGKLTPSWTSSGLSAWNAPWFPILSIEHWPFPTIYSLQFLHCLQNANPPPRVQKKSRLHGCEPEEGFLNLCQF